MFPIIIVYAENLNCSFSFFFKFCQHFPLSPDFKGCEVCPKSEDMWLEAVRLQPPEEAKKVNKDNFYLF